ncbi:MAG: YdeI/OmpD-associated family protein [Fimbriimonadaceae bacterium]|nr:YdeI/OmpD-associated family protein [Chitinophagales bacterium]
MQDQNLQHQKKKELIIPKELTTALNKNKKAKEVFEKFPYSHKKEYIQWITETKTEETKTKRIATTIEWVSEGKGRNWKYERKK